ncbi:MAG TPA: SDR family NAD(P)-dependent oxidoreductase [Ktedonobacteraceae bacterium]
MTRVLVTGGTGGLGREVVPRLVQAGYTVRVMSRHDRRTGQWPQVEWAQADLASGAGV